METKGNHSSPYRILHYIHTAFPILAGYTIRTHSIVKSQKEYGLYPSAAISVFSLLNNYFRNMKFSPKKVYDGINYYSAYNEMIKDPGFKLASKFLIKNNKINLRLRNRFYLLRRRAILSNYYDFILSEVGNIDIIHSHAPSVVFQEAQIINEFFKKKLIYELRGFWNLPAVTSNNNDILDAVKDEIHACEKADKCVAICKSIADLLLKAGIPAEKIEIVPNGVEPDKFLPGKKDAFLLDSLEVNDKIIFGYITSVRHLEGIQVMVKAWKMILKEIPNAVFLLIGEGGYLNTIKAMIKEYNIEDTFLTTGKIDHDKISAYYSLLDIFVVPRTNVPSSNLVTPLKPLEAMAAGKAIIVSDVNALKEIVSDGETGLYFRADDHENLAEICIELAKDEKLRDSLAANARSWVLKNRTWDKIVVQYSEIYKELLN